LMGVFYGNISICTTELVSTEQLDSLYFPSILA
jgi:hypothetical protein